MNGVPDPTNLRNDRIPIIKPFYNKFLANILPDLEKILESNMVTGVNRILVDFEDQVSKYFEKRVMGVSSCTNGMILAMKALGLEKKDIILPSFSFSATAAMAHWNGSKIKFADISKDSLNIDPESVKSLIDKDTGAILAVHMYGNPASIPELQELAEENDLLVLYDAAHAFGSQYQGVPVANFGDASSFSMSPTKVVSTIEGGVVSFSNEENYSKLDLLRNYGNDSNYNCPLPGLNARLSEINAAVGIHYLKSAKEAVRNRNNYANKYQSGLEDIPGLSFQSVAKGDLSTYKDFSIFVNPNEFGMNRNQLANYLDKANISTKFYFYPPIHELEPYRKMKRADLSNTVWAANSVISLPIWNYMDSEIIDYIVEKIRSAHHLYR